MSELHEALKEDLLAIQVEAEDWARQNTPEGTEEAPDGSWSVIFGIAGMALETLEKSDS